MLHEELVEGIAAGDQDDQCLAPGAAAAAGLAEDAWPGPADIRANWREGGRWTPSMAADDRARLIARWKQAVQRTLDWV